MPKEWKATMGEWLLVEGMNRHFFLRRFNKILKDSNEFFKTINNCSMNILLSLPLVPLFCKDFIQPLTISSSVRFCCWIGYPCQGSSGERERETPNETWTTENGEEAGIWRNKAHRDPVPYLSFMLPSNTFNETREIFLLSVNGSFPCAPRSSFFSFLFCFFFFVFVFFFFHN